MFLSLLDSSQLASEMGYLTPGPLLQVSQLYDNRKASFLSLAYSLGFCVLFRSGEEISEARGVEEETGNHLM
jgi:hypothetical protein